MALKIVPAPGTPAAELLQLADRELALAQREASLLERGAEIESVARDVQVRLDEARAALQRLASSPVHPEAEAAFMRSLGVVVPAHVATPATSTALEARRRALAAREEAVGAEQAAVDGRAGQLAEAERQIAEIRALAAQLAARAEQERARVEQQRRAAAAVHIFDLTQKKVRPEAPPAAAPAAVTQPAPQPVHQPPAPAPQPVYQPPAPAPQPVHQQPAPAPQPVLQPPAPAPQPVYQPPAPAPQPAPAPVTQFAAPAAAPVPVPADDGANRRQSPRHRLQAEVSLSSESNFFTGFSGDISETGVFVATYETALEPGSEVELSLALPGRPALKVGGTVKWVRDSADRTPGVFPGMGIEFHGLAPADAKAIQAFLQQREPMFWAE